MKPTAVEVTRVYIAGEDCPHCGMHQTWDGERCLYPECPSRHVRLGAEEGRERDMNTLTDLLCRVENKAVRAEIERRFAALEQERDDALALFRAPQADNDGGAADLCEEIRIHMHNSNLVVEGFERLQAENAALREALEQRTDELLKRR